MCYIMDSEVILSNLLTYHEEVSYRDIADYCDRIKERLFTQNGGKPQYISFDLNNRSLFENVLRYPAFFEYSAGKYSKGEDFDEGKRLFKQRAPVALRAILSEAARQA